VAFFRWGGMDPAVRAIVHFDGACSGNPGPMGAGAVVEVGPKHQVFSRPMGLGTNNEAEYHGLILGLRNALVLGADEVEVRGDSQLVLRHLDGTYAVKSESLRPLYEEAKALLGRFRKAELKWVRREANRTADKAAVDAVLAQKAGRPGPGT
jgi:ribonuclease HI